MRKKIRKIRPELDFAPMVALTLVLLSYFILTTTRFRDDEKDIEAPFVSSEPDLLNYHGWAISVFIFNEIGDLYWDFHGYRSEEVAEELLETGIFCEKDLESFFSYKRILLSEAENCEQGFSQVAKCLDILKKHDARPRYGIKADENTSYPMIKNLIEVFQSRNINQFGLWTRLKN